jgi:nitroimidazol reductase NimA-like FMN-containing flavoprotein (pyridoxamine 5'-phosphate oxidase superfamily)
MDLDRHGIEILDEAECRQLLATQRVGRVGLTVEALPVILPVNFALLDGEVVFRTSAGAKLGAALDEAVVCFEIDGHDDVAHEGWSVLITGRAELIESAEERHAADLLPLQPWSGVTTGFPVRIRTGMLSGRRIGLPTRAVREGLLASANPPAGPSHNGYGGATQQPAAPPRS